MTQDEMQTVKSETESYIRRRAKKYNVSLWQICENMLEVMFRLRTNGEI